MLSIIVVLQWSSDLSWTTERAVEVRVECPRLPSQLDEVAEALMAG